jgi:hypothetical protein
MPFDQFTIEQIAGDLLPGASPEQQLATAFHRNTLSNNEGGTNDELFRTIAVKDRISTTLNVWMGLTIRCAECHSHKYDPVTHTEYYQFLDYFNQTADADRPNESPTLDATEHENDSANSTQRSAAARVPVMVELPDSDRRATHVMLRGDFQNLGPKVEAAMFEFLHPMPAEAPPNRLGVAMWLVDGNNPLTARVAANRFWSQLFGRGIVETEEDFGTQGTPPSHPELLDWLAVDFQQHGWNVKRLLKQIVMSSTYRQSQQNASPFAELDPDNIYLWRGPRERLTAEMLRDQALAVSGLLSRKMYGPPVYPPNPIREVVNAFREAKLWTTSTGEDRYRRAIYTHMKRSQPHPLLDTFDIANRDVCSLRRFPTNTPLQAFMVLNDEVFFEAAQALANRMHKQPTAELQIQHGLELALVRPADAGQIAALKSLYTEARSAFEVMPGDAAQVAGPYAAASAADQSELAALVVTANVILNLDAFLTK